MITEHLIAKGVGANKGFRWRGGEITRFEGFSDAVFAFAVTLLIVSLEVPKTFNELMGTMRGFGAFAICFALLMVIWHAQYTFFRRYNLQNNYTLVLNAILIFVVLFYVYPLKFLFTLLVNQFVGAGAQHASAEPMIEKGQLGSLIMVFDLGYLAVFTIFALLYYHAYRLRSKMELNELELLDTRESIISALINMGTAVVSLVIVFVGGADHAGFAGMIYPILMAPATTIHYSIMGRKRRKLMERTEILTHASSA
jgi:uncharacterized membrane protein